MARNLKTSASHEPLKKLQAYFSKIGYYKVLALGEKINCDKSNLYSYAAGRRKMPPEVAMDLYKALNREVHFRDMLSKEKGNKIWPKDIFKEI